MSKTSKLKFTETDFKNLYEQISKEGIRCIDSNARLRSMHNSPEFAKYCERRGVAQAKALGSVNLPKQSEPEQESARFEKVLPASPHHLSALPRSLRASDTWKKLSPGARDLCRYLLEYSNTRSFKSVYVGSETIERDLGIDKRTRRRYERELQGIHYQGDTHENTLPLIRIHEPGATIIDKNGGVKTYKSRLIRFQFVYFINEDYAAFNREHGVSVYKYLTDIESAQDLLQSMCDSMQIDIRKISDTEAAKKIVLDQASKRMQIDSIDDLGRVHVRLHSTVYDYAALQRMLPHGVILVHEKRNKDAIVSPRETWKNLIQKIHKKIEWAKVKNNASGLLDFRSALRKKSG